MKIRLKYKLPLGGLGIGLLKTTRKIGPFQDVEIEGMIRTLRNGLTVISQVGSPTLSSHYIPIMDTLWLEFSK